MSDISFSNEEKVALVEKLQNYFDSELGVELGQFDGEFLLEFIAKEMGGVFYNSGVRDARTVLEKRLESIDEDLYAIEKEM